MLDKLSKWLIVVSVLVVIGGGLAVWFNALPDGQKAGQLEPTDFSSLSQGDQSEGRGYLLCSGVVCSSAVPDAGPLVFDVSLQSVIRAISAVADGSDFIRRHHVDLAEAQFEFLERLPGERIPAVVSIRLRELEFARTEVNIYTYKPIGDIEDDPHQARVERWTQRLTDRLGQPLQ